jgi:hypothetical protein
MTARADALAAAVEAYDGPFAWGVSDCCAAACNAFARLHGVDPMAPLRGKYATERGALRMIARRGGWAEMANVLARKAGLIVVTPERGALALVRLPDGRHALGLVLGPGQIAVKTETGFETIPDCERAWLPAGGATCRN